MRNIFFLSVLCILLSSCGAAYLGGTNNYTNVRLNQRNYTVEGMVQGESSSRFIFGIGRFKRLLSEARRDMLDDVEFIGTSRALANEVLDIRTHFVAPFWVKYDLTLTAHIIEFDNSMASSGRMPERGEQIEGSTIQEDNEPVECVNCLVKFQPLGLSYTNDHVSNYSWINADPKANFFAYNLAASFEKGFSNQWSVNAEVSYTFKSQDSVIFDDGFNEYQINIRDFSSFNIIPELRYYMGNNETLNGLYLGAYTGLGMGNGLIGYSGLSLGYQKEVWPSIFIEGNLKLGGRYGGGFREISGWNVRPGIAIGYKI